MLPTPSDKTVRVRVLVVEDDPILQALVTEVLLVGGYEVRAVDCLEGVRSCMEAFTPEVVLLDWSLPDGSGTDVLPALQRDWPGTTVVMMSGSGTADLPVEAIPGGAFSFLAKPFRLDELMRAVEQACEHQTLPGPRPRQKEAVPAQG